jgi:replicative DNA helicase
MTPAHVILGCCLNEPRLVDECAAAGIAADSFDTWQARELWTVLINARADGKLFDVENVFLLPGISGNENSHDLRIFIHEAVGAAPTSIYFKQSLDEVAEKSRRKRTRLAALGVCEACDTGGDVDTAIERMRMAWNKADPGVTLADVARTAIEDAQHAINGKPPAGISLEWPWPTFNKHALPIRQHEFVVVCARPSQGKSSLGAHIASKAARSGLRVLIFTLETSALQVIRQMAGQIAGVNLQQIGADLPERQVKFIETLGDIGGASNLRIIDRAMRLEDIEGHCRILRETWKPQLVIIDYLQLILCPGGSRYEQITNGSNRLMALRKAMDCPFVVMAQLSRANQADGRAPQLSDLRDSGAIEQDASRVVAIHRPETDFSGNLQMGEKAMDGRKIFDSYLMQLKHREGPVFNSRIKFHAPTTVFYEE